jgi:hypothetical protein
MADKPINGYLAGAVALVLMACSQPGPEARIRAAIDAMEAAVEAREPAGFVEHVSEDFDGDRGQFDRRSLRAFLASQMLGADAMEVVLGPPDITLHGERATVKVSALVTGGRYLGDRNETLTIVSGWRLEDGEWRCYSAERTDQ